MNDSPENTFSSSEDTKKWIAIIDKILENPSGTYYLPKCRQRILSGYTLTDYPEYGKREIVIECKELNLHRFVTIKID